MSTRLVMVGFLVIGMVATAGAQTEVLVAQCRQDGTAYQSKTLAQDRAANRTPNVSAIVAESKRITRACADRIPLTEASVAGLSALSSLYVYTGDTAKARSIVAMAVARPKASDVDRADAMLAAVQLANAERDPFTGINQEAERLVRELDALPDAVIAKKIRGHQIMLGRYGYADIDDGIRDHAQKLLELAQRALRTNALGKIALVRGGSDSVSGAYPVMVQAYGDLARAAGDYLHADSALMILDAGERAIAGAYPPAREAFERDRRMYRLVGTPATRIDGKWWINAPDGMSLKPGNGKISIVQFTAHWCVPCKKSYAPMKRLMTRFAGKPVESVMTTELYGYLGDQRNLTPEQEVEANREYYTKHHGLDFQISITAPGSRTDTESNSARYAVGGIPQIMIIDRRGVIRATVVGWDVGNERRFAAFIEKLLAEK
jgi:thiol-disulfide isomerase/thioredoxin